MNSDMKHRCPFFAALASGALVFLAACTESKKDDANAILFAYPQTGSAYLTTYLEGEAACGVQASSRVETLILDSVPHLDSLKSGTRKGRTLIGHGNTLLQAEVTIGSVTATRVRGSYRLYAEDSTGAIDTLHAPRSFVALKCPEAATQP